MFKSFSKPWFLNQMGRIVQKKTSTVKSNDLDVTVSART